MTQAIRTQQREVYSEDSAGSWPWRIRDKNPLFRPSALQGRSIALGKAVGITLIFCSVILYNDRGHSSMLLTMLLDTTGDGEAGV